MSENQENATKTFAILQLTRLGDVIQSTIAAKALKKIRPDIRLVLIARSQFSSPLKHLTDDVFDNVIELNFKEKFSSSSKLSELKESFSSFLAEINNEKIDVLINQSFSKSSQYLSSLIKAPHKLGPVADQQNKVMVSDPWSQLVYAVTMDGPLNPFNLVDVYQGVLGIPTLFEDDKEEKNSTKDQKKELNKIVLHPFSSHKKKHWAFKKWVEILFKLLKEKNEVEVTLVGSPSELEASKKITGDPLLQQFSHRIKNTVGSTNIKGLQDILDKSDLFIGHDSMVGHLAKLSNLPTLTLTLGTARQQETFPYGEHSFVVAPKTSCFPCFPKDSCQFFQCHTDIPYQAAYSMIATLVETGNLEFETVLKKSSPFYFESLSLYQSKQTKVGFYQLENLNKSDANYSDTLRAFYRISWLYKLSEVEEKHTFPVINKSHYQKLLKVLEGLQHLYELSEFGKKYSRYILEELSKQEPSIELIKDYSSKIDEIDRLKSLIKESHIELAPIVNYYTLVKSNLSGSNLVELTESSYLAYNDCSTFISVMYELIEKTLEEYKNLNDKRSGSTLNKNEGVV